VNFTTMAPKRQRPSTPPKASPKKVKKKNDQPSISAFFTSPTKPKSKRINGDRKREASVISISDSEDGSPMALGRTSAIPTVTQDEDDESMAKRLAMEWAAQDDETGLRIDKGKARALGLEDALKVESDDEIVAMDAPYADAPGINGSSSSLHRLPPSKPSDAAPTSPKKTPKVVKGNMNGSSTATMASLFSKPRPVTPPRTPPKSGEAEYKPIVTPTKGGTITSTTAEPVDAIDFDTDAFLFRPEDIDTSRWPKGRLPYSILVGVYVQVSSTRSRLKIVRVLTKQVVYPAQYGALTRSFLHLLLSRSPIDLPASLYLLSNHLLPSYVSCELGIGSQILNKAVLEVSGLQPRDLRQLWHKHGDPGDVAFEAKSNLRTLVKPSPLLVGDVYARLLGLSRVKGQQSGKVKGDVVRKLMVQARGEEVRFLVRSMIGNLRIGAVRLVGG
jgi:hypothetical protein